MLNLEIDTSKGVWRRYDADVEICIIPMVSSIVKYAKKKHTKRDHAGKNRLDKTDEDGWNNEIICKIITDWKGIVGNDGRPVECNNLNKEKLVDKFSELGSWIITEASLLAEEIAQVKKTQEKNLQTSSDSD